MKRRAIAGILCMFLAACSVGGPDTPDVESGTGAVLDASTTNAPDTDELPEATNDVLIEEAEQAAEESYGDVADALRMSYEDAAAVRDVIHRMMEDLEPAFADSVREAWTVYSDDVGSLGYYADLAEERELSPEETATVMRLSSDIELGMEAFAQMAEMIGY